MRCLLYPPPMHTCCKCNACPATWAAKAHGTEAACWRATPALSARPLGACLCPQPSRFIQAAFLLTCLAFHPSLCPPLSALHRISVYFVITAILPIVINTLLSLLVFSVSPRHLDTRLGIVVTLFLSLTALQFVINAALPSSATVVPTQQLIIVS